MNKIEKMNYIQWHIETNNYTVLPESMANGVVYKVHYRGDLEKDGYEVGFLFLSHGTSVKEHTHTDEIEMYMPIIGTLSVGGEETDVNFCFFNEKHNIDRAIGVLIVETVKLSREYLLNDSNCKDKEYQKVLLKKMAEIDK